MRLSIGDLSDLNSYTVSLCEEEIRELVTYINNPPGEQRTIPQVLGRLALLCNCKAQLQAAAHVEQLMALYTSYLAEQQSKSLLQDECKRETGQLKKVLDDVRQDWDKLRLQLYALNS